MGVLPPALPAIQHLTSMTFSGAHVLCKSLHTLQVSDADFPKNGHWRRIQKLSLVDFFFLRLPNGQYGPVSRMFQPKTKYCTGPFNWGGAHCAGEKVKRETGPFLQKSHQKQAKSKQGTARHGNQEPPGQAPRYTGQEANNTTPRDFEHRSRYALTYIEVFRTCANPIMYKTHFTLHVKIHERVNKSTASYGGAKG